MLFCIFLGLLLCAPATYSSHTDLEMGTGSFLFLASSLTACTAQMANNLLDYTEAGRDLITQEKGLEDYLITIKKKHQLDSTSKRYKLTQEAATHLEVYLHDNLARATQSVNGTDQCTHAHVRNDAIEELIDTEEDQVNEHITLLTNKITDLKKNRKKACIKMALWGITGACAYLCHISSPNPHADSR